MIKFAHKLHYIIANLLPSWHLHFGTGLKMYCKSDFHPVNCTILGYQTAELVRVAPKIFWGKVFGTPGKCFII